MAEYKLNYTGEEVQKKLDVVPTDSKPNQYLVTDGEGNAKWEDKLCWSEEGKVTLVEPFTEEYGEEVPNRNRFPLTLEEGKNYTVKWDGVEYDCTCFVDDWNRLVVGNASLMEAGANTNEPFLVGVQDGDSFVKAQTGGDHELSISCIGETIHPIDKKYLPSGILYADETRLLFHDSNFTNPVLYEEGKVAGNIIIHYEENDGERVVDFYPVFKNIVERVNAVEFHCIDYDDNANPGFKTFYVGVAAG